MSGFTGLIFFNNSNLGKLAGIKFSDIANSAYPKLETIQGDSHRFAYYGMSRFYTASLIHSNQDKIFGLEGIFLNIEKEDLETKIEIESEELKPSMEFLHSLKNTHGSFSGFIYNKSNKELFLFTDQTASHQVFYYIGNEIFAFSSSIFMLCDILRQLNIKTSLSEPASYMMLSIGYLLKDYTLVNEIKKLEAGKYLMLNEKAIEVKEYHNYYTPILFNKINQELLKELDTRFKNSVFSEYQYDKKMGYKYLTTLSGGLDSRMNLLTAWEMGFRDITALTFCEGMEPDEIVSRQITNDLKIQHIILLLNNGLHLFDIEGPLLLNNCAVFYFGAAHTYSAVQKLDFSCFGLLHNGILAESSKGTYLTGPEHKPPQLVKSWLVSDKLLNRVQGLFENEIADSYPNEEMFNHYSRGFNAAHNGSWMARPYTESVYSFMEPNFAEFAFSIHPSLRYNAFLTISWLNNLHRNMSSYKRVPYGFNPTNNQVKSLAEKVLRKFGKILSGNYHPSNLMDRWYKSNDQLREFVNVSYMESNARSFISPGINKDIAMLFKLGKVNEKMLCISYLKSVDLLFLNIKS